MKTTLITLLLSSFFFISSSIAQSEVDETTVEYPTAGDSEISVSLGLYSGYVSVDNDFGPDENSGYVRNLGLAAAYDYYFSKTWSIRGKLHYDPKGGSSNDGDLKFNATYLSLPVMANWHFGKRKRWYLQFGPSVSYLLSADVSDSIDSVDVKDQLNSAQFGFDFGIGVKIPIGGMMFFIETDGVGDFSNYVKDSGFDGNETLARNTLSLGVVF